jgi:hypothetical protein
VTYEGYADAPGQQTVTINKNGDNYTRDADLQGWGTYAFDIRVQDTKTGDSQSIRSTNINMPRHSMEFVAPDEENAPEKLVARVGYYLEGARDASEVRVDLIDPNLDLKTAKSLETKVRTEYKDIDIYSFQEGDDEGDYIGVFMAEAGGQ